MKKILIGLLTVIVVMVGGSYVLNYFVMGGSEYFVKITTDGDRKETKDDAGRKFIEYDYKLAGFDKKGQKKTLDFTAIKDRPLRKDAYLKVTWNSHKGVTTYEEVKKPEIPQAAQLKLN